MVDHVRRKVRTSMMLFILAAVSCFVSAEGYEASRSMPIQMDVAANKHITICTGLKRYISCHEGSNIAITHAFWGRTSDKICPSDDGDPVTDCEGADETMGLVQKYCETKDECELQAKHSKLQKNGTHHCPGVNKYLIVNYTCIPESKGEILCDSEETTLECPAKWKIDVTQVQWGRRSNAKFCGTGSAMLECDSSESAGRYIRAKCNDKESCVVKADAEVLDDKKSTCAGMLKYLMLRYVCKPNTKRNEDDENDVSSENKLLTDPSSKELMGLLEKHLNEMKTPDSAPKAPLEEKHVEARQPTSSHNNLAKGAASYNPAIKAKVRDMLGKASGSPVANEDEETVTSFLNGPAFVRSIPSKEPQPKKEQAVQGVKKDLTPSAQSAIHENPAIHEKESPAESPAADLKETASAKKVQESVPQSANAVAKDSVPTASKDTATKEDYELSEPNTVKSILARAKEVLKTLDSEEEANDVKKKSNIAKKKVDGPKLNMTVTAAQQVAKLAEDLANQAETRSLKAGKAPEAKIKQAGAAAVQAPKPGPPKTGLKATGTGNAGAGNIP